MNNYCFESISTSYMKYKGFSLIELIIVLLIVSIMAFYSYPSYKNYLIKMRRIDGKIALFDLANRLENYHLLNNSYEKATIATGTIYDVLSSEYSKEGWYRLRIIESSKTSFLIQAIAWKSQAIDDVFCKTYTLNNEGLLGTADGC